MIQVVKVSKEKQIKMYRKLKKKKLAEMLYAANMALETLQQNNGGWYVPNYPLDWRHSNPTETVTNPTISITPWRFT